MSGVEGLGVLYFRIHGLGFRVVWLGSLIDHPVYATPQGSPSFSFIWAELKLLGGGGGRQGEAGV